MQLDVLNPEQRKAVTTTEGPLLVLAGAGTGKTRVITYRIAHLLARGAPPGSILAVTFTNKAAAEMKERVAKLVGADRAKGITIGTFHSICLRLLREHGEKLGFPKHFTICDESDRLAAIKAVLRDLRVGEATIHPAALGARISLLKNRLVSAADAAAAAADDLDHLVARAYGKYDERIRRARSFDFDDLLLEALRLLREAPGVREACRARWRYVMVDEYQDTNGPQYEIVREISAGHGNLCVVGDDDQSIYGWRGADVGKILHFERDFRKATVVRLETNYRSTRPILEAANAVIRNNTSRHEKSLRSALGDGTPIAVVEAEDEEKEADFVVRDILERLKKDKARLSDIAILFRTAMQPRPFEARLRAEKIRYDLVGGMSFFDRKEVRDVLAFLKLVVNPDDEVSLLRVVNVPPRGVGDTTVDRVLEFATSEGIPASKAFERAAEIPKVPPAAAAAVLSLRNSLAALQGASGFDLVPTIRKALEIADYRSELLRCYPEPRVREARWAAVAEMLNFAENHVRRSGNPSLAGFLQELTLSADDQPQAKEQRKEAVTLMTLHSAKGLEFPRVYIVGLEEGLLPHEKSVKEDGIEEERRLMYVGITRAQRHLTLTRARSRARHGRRTPSPPSRFLLEMSPSA
jgi:DNA helicase-2/ATP-dependent DNA helicase PcrA